jgi:hypothetical protein
MPSDRSSLQALKRLISEVDLLLETTTPLPENRTARSRELLGAALALTDDLLATAKPGKSAAAILGSKGGNATAKKLGSDHFRQLAAKRTTRAGGRPKKTV